MTKEEEKEEIKNILDCLVIMKWRELAELGVNAQQAQKIKRGEMVRFYGKTLVRLRSLIT